MKVVKNFLPRVDPLADRYGPPPCRTVNNNGPLLTVNKQWRNQQSPFFRDNDCNNGSPPREVHRLCGRSPESADNHTAGRGRAAFKGWTRFCLTKYYCQVWEFRMEALWVLSKRLHGLPGKISLQGSVALWLRDVITSCTYYYVTLQEGWVAWEKSIPTPLLQKGVQFLHISSNASICYWD